MAGPSTLHLIILGTAVSFSMTFNIDIVGPKIYNGSREDFFGFKALQFQSGNERGIFVSAPLQNNGTGGVFICDDTTPNCRPLPLPSPGEATSENSFKEVGISLAVKTKPSLQFTACSPAWSHECDGTPYLNSICYQWSRRDSSIFNITSAHKECTKQKVDVVFLLDGSRSIMDGDFIKSKEFVKSFMNKTQNTSIQFAAVQFSMGFRTIFTFKDFQDKKAFEKLEDEKQIGSLTNTHKAIRFTLVKLFDNPESGRHPDAEKAVVIITNGNPSDLAIMASLKVDGISKTILEVCEARHIIRFVIGVGHGVNKAKLRKLASEPKLNNSFYIDNYAGLSGLLKNLQTKIFNIEGFKHNLDQTWEKEPLQTGTSTEFTKACSPVWRYECDGTPYFNTICYQWSSRGLRECTKQNVDVLFLFGGSWSMTDGDFTKTKELIKAFMNKMQNTSIQFAAVQFSTGFQTVFTFKDFQDKKAFEKLENERRMKNLTSTHMAMRSTLVNLFDNPENGGHPDATKAVVIINGNPKDAASMASLKVGNEKQKMTKLSLASEPSWNNTLQNYVGLNGLMTNLENIISNKKGSEHNLDWNWEEKLSQSGMSAEFAEDMLIWGAVGSNNWKGSLYQIDSKNSPELEIQNPYMWNGFYMGYSVAVGKKNGIRIYFAGAPRYNHRGQVISATKTQNLWTVLQRVDSEQIGSYFGSELCAFDIDSDGTTDFLMVGAPLYHEPQRESHMYVYVLTGENKLEKVQTVSVSSQGRFASSIASLRDLNGDGLQDLAVGAPLEDDQRGAIYIYLGDKTMGIRPKHSQHIRAGMLSEGLQQFGGTIDGKSDTDGLTEIAVGARGHVVLLRSRPVFSVSAHLSFSPPEITRDIDSCSEQKEAFHVFCVTVCFKMTEQTKSTKDVLSTGLKVDYELTVDSQRQNSRGFFAQKNSRSIQTRLHLNKTETCQKHTIYLHCQNCGVDTGSPFEIKVYFSQTNNQQPYGILNVDSEREALVEVPFEYNRP